MAKIKLGQNIQTEAHPNPTENWKNDDDNKVEGRFNNAMMTRIEHRESKCPKIHFGWWRRHGLTIFKNKKLQTSHLTH